MTHLAGSKLCCAAFSGLMIIERDSLAAECFLLRGRVFHGTGERAIPARASRRGRLRPRRAMASAHPAGPDASVCRQPLALEKKPLATSGRVGSGAAYMLRRSPTGK